MTYGKPKSAGENESYCLTFYHHVTHDTWWTQHNHMWSFPKIFGYRWFLHTSILQKLFFSPSHILPWSVQKHHTSKHWVPHNFNNHVLSLVVFLSFGLWAPQFQWREVLMQQHNDILHNNVLLTLCQLFVFGPFLFKRNNAQSQLHKRTVFPVLVWKTGLHGAMTSTSSNNFGMNWKVNISDRPCE